MFGITVIKNAVKGFIPDKTAYGIAPLNSERGNMLSIMANKVLFILF